ncbi:competence protein ComEA [Methylomagnum ishizawai]|uniref:Competence protein ComEA n=1 Tax=Methylomagnum ishizawai TaxID=1760988 RepID=A0A1Y6D2M2_9GAMM|nr:ComEA family DNA-binding protein [Methylomagnum ishizawai]SMF94812.1 competence protein ComEA [Methylomagnum ishizawai]
MRALLKFLLLWGLLVSPFWVSAEVLDINTATAGQFDDTLVGVGKAKAQAIVEDREKNGPFKSVDDLERVKGIGPATIAKNRDKITVGAVPPATVATPPEAKPKQK